MIGALSDGQSLKDMLVAQSPEQIESLQQTSFYYRMARFLRSTAWVNLFWGGLTLWVGLAAPIANFLSTVQAIVGALIIVQSLLAIVRPRAWGLLALAILLLLVGLWNIAINIIFNFVGVNLWLNILWIIVGILQLRWAYQTYRMYRVFSAHTTSKPTTELAKMYDSLWEGLAHPTPALSPELLMMKLAGNRYWWNVMLLPDQAILAHKRQRVLMLVARADLILVPDNPKAILRDQVAMFARIGAESWPGKIYPGSFQQYMKWKGITDPQAELDQTTRRKRLARRMSRWFSIFLAVVFIYGMVSAMASMPRFP